MSGNEHLPSKNKDFIHFLQEIQGGKITPNANQLPEGNHGTEGKSYFFTNLEK